MAGALANRREANGAAEFEQSLHASGQTLEDAKLEVETELASAAVRKKVLARAPSGNEVDVQDFYRSHQRLFLIPERRTVELLESLPSPVAARALVSRIGDWGGILEESPSRGTADQPRRTLAARHRTRHARCLSRSRRCRERATEPQQPLGRLRREEDHAGELQAACKGAPRDRRTPEVKHRAATLATFTAAYRKRWTAKTNCHPGYVVQGCVQYAGPRQPEPNPFPGE